MVSAYNESRLQNVEVPDELTLSGCRKLAASLLRRTIDDYKRRYLREECETFLEGNLFGICCELLGFNVERARDLMMDAFYREAMSKDEKQLAV